MIQAAGGEAAGTQSKVWPSNSQLLFRYIYIYMSPKNNDFLFSNSPENCRKQGWRFYTVPAWSCRRRETDWWWSCRTTKRRKHRKWGKGDRRWEWREWKWRWEWRGRWEWRWVWRWKQKERNIQGDNWYIYFTYLLLIAFTWQQFHKKNTWVK